MFDKLRKWAGDVRSQQGKSREVTVKGTSRQRENAALNQSIQAQCRLMDKTGRMAKEESERQAGDGNSTVSVKSAFRSDSADDKRLTDGLRLTIST